MVIRRASPNLIKLAGRAARPGANPRGSQARPDQFSYSGKHATIPFVSGPLGCGRETGGQMEDRTLSSI
ncbi:hypothetical protein VTN31DRAFT_3911 [Thermomyces dupontii]|uniref:uncharacterized protein n=1 Tax=Talaromyces thermophilus TaxID=28565 RepID=UPI003743B51F